MTTGATRARLEPPAQHVHPLAGPELDGWSPGGREARTTRSVYPLRQSRRGATRRSTTRCENPDRPTDRSTDRRRSRPFSSEIIYYNNDDYSVRFFGFILFFIFNFCSY